MGKIDESKLLQQSRRGLLSILFSRTTLVVLLLLANFVLLFSFLLGLLDGLPLLTGSMTVFTAAMMLYVLNTADNPTLKLSWCAIIGVLPVFGAALYCYIRSDLGHRIAKRLVNSSIEASLPHVPEQEKLLTQLREEEPEFAGIAQYLHEHAHASVCAEADTRYFPSGESMFAQMLQELEKAEEFIFLEYFIVEQGQMWGSILDVLHRKAQAGVEVRLLYDGTCAITTLPSGYPRQMEQLGIRCRMFAPVRPLVSTHYNYRDHRKIMVIDGRTAFTGGVNLADEYINVREKYGHWKDTGLMVRGEAARSFTLLFLQMWNYPDREREFAPYLKEARRDSAPGYVIPFGCGPSTPERVGEMVYLNMLSQARDHVYIMTPYLILDGEMVTALRFAARRGVDVRLVLPHIPDKKYAFALAKSHYRELLEAGVKIYEYTPGFVHGKVFLCDGRHGVVGTINLDFRSLYLHYECGAYLYKVPALADMRRDFEDTLEKSRRITMEDVKMQSLLSRATAAILKVFAPLM